MYTQGIYFQKKKLTQNYQNQHNKNKLQKYIEKKQSRQIKKQGNYKQGCLFTQQQQQQQPHLRPIIKKQLLPANQIIQKIYQADKKAQIKLITYNNIKKTIALNVSKQQKQENLQIIKKYLFDCDFQQCDTLGYHIMKNTQIKNILYIKFDNSLYNKCKDNGIKYISGYFIPYTDLIKFSQNQEIKKEKNIYKTLSYGNTNNISELFNNTSILRSRFPAFQHKINIQNSFSKNCFSVENQVKFSSNYEGSNLFMALKKGNLQYDLILQNDINSKGTTQWFNFALSTFQQGLYKFNIINLTKTKSLFQKGMKIACYSYQNKNITNISWVKDCSNITYSQNQIKRQESCQRFYYTLHFQFNSIHKQDTLLFSYGFPYGNLQLQKFFHKITYKKVNNLLKIDKLKICQTISGLPVYVYQITHKKTTYQQNYLKSVSSQNVIPTKPSYSSFQNFITYSKNPNNKTKQDKGIVFMGRQHPGQSQSSFLIQGIIQFLLQSNQYDNSKKNFTYYIFPLINMDGIHYGNYRTNLSGVDLNRIWKHPRKDFHSEVYYIKKYLFNINKITPLKLIIDLHGHSNALNSFFYGNPIKKQNLNQSDNPKLFPFFCSKNLKQVSFIQSTFKISQDKKNSARVVLNQMFPKALVYTLETSFYGYKKGKKIVEFTQDKYRKLGKNILINFLQFSKINQRNPKHKEKLTKQIQQINFQKKTENIQIFSDSDSQASQDLIQFSEQIKKIDQKINNLTNQEDQKIIQPIKKNTSNLRIYSTKNRQRNFSRDKLSLSPKQNQKNFHNFQRQNLKSNGSINSNGFLSIVKIQTKKNLNQNKQKIYEQKQKQNSQRFVQGSSLKLDIIMQNRFSKDSSLYQFQCINQKQFLAKNRKKVNQILEQLNTKNFLKTLRIGKSKQNNVQNS